MWEEEKEEKHKRRETTQRFASKEMCEENTVRNYINIQDICVQDEPYFCFPLERESQQKKSMKDTAIAFRAHLCTS
jgi:hypothetical protein